MRRETALVSPWRKDADNNANGAVRIFAVLFADTGAHVSLQKKIVPAHPAVEPHPVQRHRQKPERPALQFSQAEESLTHAHSGPKRFPAGKGDPILNGRAGCGGQSGRFQTKYKLYL
ncbi:hypothetical protein G6L63_13805 [Agrobacterium vitis]|uniref:Uncharacterized protein n=1 Tax=Agrobacterium vitis TaxID=373 RepID=A0A368NR05_AGRVI|nr:hypothetical protein [Agrobacterium vitis]KAA3516793.1 hypothetical protein DXM22_09910 [Agrobacterium vitis]KAA3529559.1 hypothetical protein DXT89_07435 [Agrobacterium vitis]MCF1477448.1 hypothetical protein [Agrobacterium vitis]MUZ97173.1 hypothetical protein [Agrobacterium vitis]MVA28183.1 hypothetical protein [Agrobacterium vitis]